ncbi:pilus assembly protein PilP [Agarilytica rhodophyticola]|uniref:pilus assembly protein PilP n=1 Tax=Agarilytica rhodophyticola TaxID=1737490 RepID=UPI000B349974|nr:pilus assembly protein PilP [Agarilytica rhodophyticola]
MSHITIKSFCAASLLASLVACSSGGEHSDLTDYIAKTKARPAGNIEPLPTFRPFEAFIYSATAKRSPFDRPVEIKRRIFAQSSSDVKPNLNRVREYLEGFELGEVKMVGNIKRKNVLWALLSDPNGVIHWVKNGNYVGKNHGRIIETAENKVELLEIVSDGLDGWVERPRVIALSEEKE